MEDRNTGTLTGFFDNEHRAAQASVIYEGRTIGLREIMADSRRVAGAFARLGIGHGDRVAIWLPSCPAWLTCFLACARLGAIVVSINTRYRSAELEDILARSGARLLLFWPGYRHLDFVDILEGLSDKAMASMQAIVEYDELPAPPRFSSIHGRPVLPWRELLESPALEADHAADGDGCIMFTTSGTTRAPKFVLHSHNSIRTHVADIAQAFGFLDPGGCNLLIPPLCGVFGFCMAMSSLAAARPLVLLHTFQAQETVALIRRHQVTHMAVVGDVVAQLLAATPEARPFPSLRAVIGVRAGQAAPAEARGLVMQGTYGSSELQAMLSLQPLTASAAQRELGGGTLVAPEGRVRTRDENTGLLLAHGAHGELEFRLPSRMLGYFDNPEATAAALTEDGWYRSGDLGYTVSETEFVFLSRMGDALRLSGFLVNPGEIESFMQDHPGILAVQVVGVQSGGNLVPVAFVRMRPCSAFDEAEILDYCARHMARYKVPRRVFAVEAFPVTQGANGDKVQKTRLREMALALMG